MIIPKSRTAGVDCSRFRLGLRRQGTILYLSDLLGSFICISWHKLARRLFVSVLKSNVSIFRLISSVV